MDTNPSTLSLPSLAYTGQDIQCHHPALCLKSANVRSAETKTILEQIFFRVPFFMLLWREKAERRIKEYFNGCITMENISLKKPNR